MSCASCTFARAHLYRANLVPPTSYQSWRVTSHGQALWMHAMNKLARRTSRKNPRWLSMKQGRSLMGEPRLMIEYFMDGSQSMDWMWKKPSLETGLGVWKQGDQGPMNGAQCTVLHAENYYTEIGSLRTFCPRITRESNNSKEWKNGRTIRMWHSATKIVLSITASIHRNDIKYQLFIVESGRACLVGYHPEESGGGDDPKSMIG